MLRVSNLSKTYAERVLFSQVNININNGDRIALVGPNGCGKTTLLNILAGTNQPDSGEIIGQRNISAGYLKQDINPSSEKPLLDEIMEASPRVNEIRENIASIHRELEVSNKNNDLLLRKLGELQYVYEAAGAYRFEHEAKTILCGLGFAVTDFARPLSNFSGGWLMRVSLAKLLLINPDFLLLDEPTNHLDMGACIWFEKYLLGYKGAVMVTSHDRAFLNRTVGMVLAIEHGEVIQHRGNYDDYVIARQQEMEFKQNESLRQEREIKREMKFIDRFRSQATHARQVQSRLKRIEKIQKIVIPRTTKKIHFSFPEPTRCGKEAISLKHVRMSYGDHVVYKDLNLVLERGDKVALVGPNGTGKTTLLKILAGVLPIDGGERKPGQNAVTAYYAQYLLELLNPQNSVLAEMQYAAPTQTERDLRKVLGAFLFGAEDIHKPVAVLSGGEKARLALARMLIQPSNVLLMDEPTNHLDIGSREILADALNDYQGTICLITHDRTLIQEVATKIIDIQEGEPRVFYGDFDSFLKWKAAGEQAAANLPADKSGKNKTEPTNVSISASNAERLQRKKLKQESLEAARRVAKAEEQIAALEAELIEVESLLSDSGRCSNLARVTEAGQRHLTLKKELDALSQEWEMACLAAEQANRD